MESAGKTSAASSAAEKNAPFTVHPHTAHIFLQKYPPPRMVLSSGMWYNPHMIREDTRAIREMLRMMGTDDWDLFLAYCPLTRREREIAYMVYREGLSVKEISRETGMSCGNVQRIRRGIYGKIRTFASASVFSLP